MLVNEVVVNILIFLCKVSVIFIVFSQKCKFSGQILVKSSNMKFHVQREPCCFIWTDGRTGGRKDGRTVKQDDAD